MWIVVPVIDNFSQRQPVDCSLISAKFTITALLVPSRHSHASLVAI